ncbi:hypothetical protein B0G76_8251 [Paraburkholderia sp. BL23I1N1]|uniref:hypothetical protein n=1 Tax=Paraburkholderia sp. BL23I1N1 TaxID=1938802 RepID=UPI000FF224E0|nr:hypothetical protein [Paraburkholderia sp. BL23I1N1]RKE24366.1 hypothetical protein B0G76_8251 [Paraburkholderia sp. BL23I1N1]
MNGVLRVLLAVVLTVPVFLGLTRIDSLLGWLYSESGYRTLGPLFHLFGAVGVEGHESVIAGVLLVISFILALCIASLVFTLLKRRKAREVQTRS